MIKIQFLKLHEDAIIPERQSEFASGLDLYTIEDIEVQGGETQLVRTGLAMQFPESVANINEAGVATWLYNLEAQIRARSSVAKGGLIVTNSPGTIDADYRGEIKILLSNIREEGYRIRIPKGSRVAQLVMCPVLRADTEEVDALTITTRGEGGFGSTDEKETV